MAATTKQIVEITRIFDAPRGIVFDAWKDCDAMMAWWGPRDFTTPVCEADFRLGGTIKSCMRSSDGAEYWGKGVYKEIVEPERIVFTDSFSDKDGNVVPATHYGMSPDFPLEMLVTVTFEDIDGKTKLVLRHDGIPGKEVEMCAQGWSESFDKLSEYLAGELG